MAPPTRLNPFGLMADRAVPVASAQRRSALAIVDAFNRMDTQTIASYRARHCRREVFPASLGHPSQTNADFQRSLNMFRAVFRHYALDVHELVDDVAARKVCLWMTARADTVAGKYECDMVWVLTFDDDGGRVVAWKEFLDASVTTDFLPELMDDARSRRRERGEGEGVKG